MKRLDVLDLFELGAALGTLKKAIEREKAPGFECYVALTGCRRSLESFRAEQKAFPLAGDSASDLIQAISSALVLHFLDPNDHRKFKDDLDFNAELTNYRWYNVKTKISEFEHVFSAVCRKCETYFIEQKMGFDISLLLHGAEANLHESIRSIISQSAIDEIKDAGRCFALENYTAAGFHVLRALEVVMADYYKQVSGKDKEFRSWYDYVEAFGRLAKTRGKRNSAYPSPKVAAMLDRMRQLDRNPLMHPRESLDEMAADTLFKLGIVTITELAKDMREMAGQAELKLVTTDVATQPA